MSKPKVYLWRYKTHHRNYPGYHMTADCAGITYLENELRNAQLSSKPRVSLTIKLSKPTENEYGVPNCPTSPKPFTEWQIDIDLQSETELFQFSEVASGCKLTISKAKLPELLNGLEEIRKGEGDYYIGERGSELWFWWRVV